jgi:hypothetical protein
MQVQFAVQGPLTICKLDIEDRAIDSDLLNDLTG